MKSLFLFLILFTFNLHSFTPGKWSYLDRFVFGSEKSGPASETVKSRTGLIVYSASYEYNSEGQLIAEKFLNGKGEADGEILYTYENGKLATEELFAPDKSSQEKKTFHYSQKGNLKEINVVLGNGKGLLRHRIISMTDSFVTECETKWEEEGNQESFTTKKDVLDELVSIQEVFDEKKKSIGSIKYFFDKNGRLEKRENVLGGSKRMQQLIYDESGRLISFSFHVKQDEIWVLVKTHYLSYK
jgi:antitoxin component YwqK of YwqJK toxin-antitoxin module